MSKEVFTEQAKGSSQMNGGHKYIFLSSAKRLHMLFDQPNEQLETPGRSSLVLFYLVPERLAGRPQAQSKNWNASSTGTA